MGACYTPGAILGTADTVVSKPGLGTSPHGACNLVWKHSNQVSQINVQCKCNKCCEEVPGALKAYYR